MTTRMPTHPHAFDGNACCDTFRRIPMPTRLMTSEDPPLLTNGNGIPFVGINPSTTLMLMNACTATIVVSPSARKAPNESGARSAMRNPRHVTTQKHSRTRSEEHTSELQSLAYLVCRLLLEKKK